jgi:hypothetical protein
MATSGDMVTALVAYLEKNLKKGYKIDDLRWALVNQKHSRIEIEKAIKIIEARTPSAKKDEERKEEIKIATQEQIVEPERKRGFLSRLFG